MIRFSLLTLFVLCQLYGRCQERDTIYMKNGQVLVGDVKSANMGVVTIDDQDLKLISVKVYKIKRLNAVHTIYRIETNNKKIYYSTLRAGPGYGEIEIQNADSTFNISLEDIAIFLPIEKGFFQRLDGNFGLGFSYTKSSKIGQMNMNATVYYTTRLIDYQLTASAIYSLDSSHLSRDNENAQLFAAYSLSSSWFAAGLLSYQRNLELSLARRYQEMIGAGNKVLLKRNWQIWALSGLTLAQEKSTDGVSTVQLEMPFMFRFSFFRYQKVNMQLNATQTFYVSLTQAGRVRYDGNINYSYELIHNFYLSINIYSNYDSKPPIENSSKVDYGVALSISYRF